MISRLAAEFESTALRRGVLGLLTILWLNMAMAPCALAFQVDDDCPHCPPAEEHAPHHTMGAHEGHDHPVAKPSCATAQTDCCDAIAASAEGRGSKLEHRPASDVVFAGPPLSEARSALRCPYNRRAADPPEIIGCSPPIRTLYCVYLK